MSILGLLWLAEDGSSGDHPGTYWTGRYWASRYWNDRYWVKAQSEPLDYETFDMGDLRFTQTKTETDLPFGVS